MSARERRRAAAAGRPVTPTLAEALDRVPTWAAPVLYAVVTVVVFREFVFSRDMLFGSDTLALGYAARHFLAEALATTGFPRWNPHILGGTPFLESLAGGDALHPLSLALLAVMETHRAIGWKLVIHVFLAGVFMFGWLRTIGATRSAALVGGLAFLLAPATVSLVWPGHDGKIYVTAMAPLLFWMAEWIWSRRDLVPAALLGVSIAVVILSAHFQMAYFLFGGVGAYMTFRAIQVGRQEGWSPAGRGFGLFLAAAVLGAGASAVQLLPAVDYVTKHSRRTVTTVEATPEEARAYSASFSLHAEEAVGLVVPEFPGSSVGGAAWAEDTYWGRNGFKLDHEYLGVVVLLLAALALTGGAGAGLRWFLAGMGGVALLFALGANTPVWRVFYELIPGISLFRAPSQAIFLTSFATATLAGLGLDRGAALAESRAGARRLLAVLAGGAGLLLIGALFAASGLLFQIWTGVLRTALTTPQAAALENARPHIVNGFFLAFLLSALVAGAWWAAARRKLGGLALTGLLVALVGLDLLRVNAPFVQVIDPAQVTVPDANVRFLVDRAREEPPFRVFSAFARGQDVMPAAFGIDLAAGHHPNDLGRYRDLIGMVGSDVPEHLATLHPYVLGILNVRYILWPDAQFGLLEDQVEGIEVVSRLQLPDGRVWASVYAYPGFPRGRVVGVARVVPEGSAMDVILDLDDFDPWTETVLESPPPIEPGGPEVTGRVRWVERTPNRLVFDVEASGPALVVVADNWFPSWRATVDGAEAAVLRADHTLRAVAVPGGEHRIEMWFDSPLVRRGLLVSVASILLLVGGGGASALRGSGRNPAPPAGPRDPPHDT